MKIVLAYEFKDLKPEVQEKVRDQAINQQIENEMEVMWDQIQNGHITEERLIEIFGMESKIWKSVVIRVGWVINIMNSLKKGLKNVQRSIT